MPIRARVLTKIEFPEEVEIEIEDTVRGEKRIERVKFDECLLQVSRLGAVDLENLEPAELLSIACAIAKHRAIDKYLLSIGVDPHKDVQPLEEE